MGMGAVVKYLSENSTRPTNERQQLADAMINKFNSLHTAFTQGIQELVAEMGGNEFLKLAWNSRVRTTNPHHKIVTILKLPNPQSVLLHNAPSWH